MAPSDNGVRQRIARPLPFVNPIHWLLLLLNPSNAHLDLFPLISSFHAHRATADRPPLRGPFFFRDSRQDSLPKKKACRVLLGNHLAPNMAPGESKGERDERVAKLWDTLDTRQEGHIDLNGLKKGLKKIDHRKFDLVSRPLTSDADLLCLKRSKMQMICFKASCGKSTPMAMAV